MKRAFWVIVLLFLARIALSAVPPLINYQGHLTGSAGQPIDTTFSMTFTIFDDSTAGNAVWSEIQANVTVSEGLFNVLLGSVDPISDSVFADTDRWLGIAVAGGAELAPRTRIVSSAYAQRVATVDGAKGGIIGSKVDILDSLRSITYESHVSHGVVGINWYAHDSVVTLPALTFLNNISGNDWAIRETDSGDLQMISRGDDGNVNIVGNGDYRTNLSIDGSLSSSCPGGIVTINTYSSNDVASILLQTSTASNQWVINHKPSGSLYFGPRNGDGTLYIVGNGSYVADLEVEGQTTTSVLQITGGSDLAEPFNISDNKDLVPGSVVVIDDTNPGHLALSNMPYDKRAAGVISGAGGIKPGLTLNQSDVFEGDHLVALTGKVYVLASTENGPISPGDRLTTSSTPGHCMKATDSNQWDGAVIGKAMTSLPEGQGLVLVLISLQ